VLELIPDDDGGPGSVVDPATGLRWRVILASMDWSDAVNHCDDLDYLDHQDWRLANNYELLTLVDFDANHADRWGAGAVFAPALPRGETSIDIWSLTTQANLVPFSLTIDIIANNTNLTGGPGGRNIRVLCTRYERPPVLVPERFEAIQVEEMPVVIDHLTGLEWQRQGHGGEMNGVLHGEARAYCNGLPSGAGRRWRTPTVHELYSLIDDRAYRVGAQGPALDRGMFADEPCCLYWSTNLTMNNAARAWNVDFRDGSVQWDRVADDSAFLRCVRSPLLPNP